MSQLDDCRDDCDHIFREISLFCAANDFDMHATAAAWTNCLVTYLVAFYKHDDETRMEVADKIIQCLRENSKTVKQ